MVFTARGRRLAYLLFILAATIVPVILQIFFLADTSQVASLLEHRIRSLEADGFLTHSVDGGKFQKSSLREEGLAANEYQRILYDLLTTRRNDGHFELTSSRVISETFQLENDRKKSIDAMVTLIIAVAVPVLAFLYAFVFLRTPKGPWTKKRMRRKERILRDLVECRIQLPAIATTTTTKARNQEDARECPICLSAFTPGEVVIAPKYCHCCIRTATNKSGADRIATVDNPSIKNDTEPNYNHRTTTCSFHESCILKWLSQRKTNPKKLCPCCRQPFFGSCA